MTPRPAILSKLAAKPAPKPPQAPVAQQPLPLPASPPPPPPAPAPPPKKSAKGKAAPSAQVVLPASLRPPAPGEVSASARAAAPPNNDPATFGEEFLVQAMTVKGLSTFPAVLVEVTSQRLTLEREDTGEVLIFSRALGLRVGKELSAPIDYSASISGDDLRRINSTPAFPNVPYNPGAP